jgi:hypothetical protein
VTSRPSTSGEVDEPGVQGVVAGPQRAADDGAAVVRDGEPAAPHAADQRAGGDPQARLLAQLPHDRRGVVLARLDPAAGHGPPPAPGVVGPLHEQQAALVVVDQATHAGDGRGSVVALCRHRSVPRPGAIVVAVVTARYNER